jgi:hypothetical protein
LFLFECGMQAANGEGMNTIRLYLTAAVVLLCAAVAAVQAGADQFSGESAAADVPAAPEDGGPHNWQVSRVSGTLNLRSANLVSQVPAAATPRS